MKHAPFTCAALALLFTGCTEQTTTQRQATGQDAKVVVCAPGSFMNGNECIPVQPDCPAGTTLRDGACVSAQVAVEPEPLPPKSAPATSMATVIGTFDEVLDTRQGHQRPRSRQLLITEIQGLEALFANTAKNAPDRPRLMRRLAEGYIELAAAAARDGQATTAAAEITKAQKLEKAAQVAAIKYYTQLVQQYPSFCATAPSTGCNDEALYYLALEYIRASVLDSARKTALQLIQQYPQSPFIPYAYFLFGEMFYAESASDPAKWPLAEQSYLEVVKYNASPIAPYALLRLAETYDAQGDAAKAKATRTKVVSQYPNSPAAQRVMTP